MTGSGRLKLPLLCAALAAAGCGQRASEPLREVRTRDLTHHKPQAPVGLQLTAARAASGTHVVTATATPTENVRALEIVIAGPDGEHVGRHERVAAGETRALSARFRVEGGALVQASARVMLRPGFAPNRTAEIVLGSLPIARSAPIRTVALPSGERIDEVRR